jgi:hypothetical protein
MDNYQVLYCGPRRDWLFCQRGRRRRSQGRSDQDQIGSPRRNGRQEEVAALAAEKWTYFSSQIGYRDGEPARTVVVAAAAPGI